MVARLADGDRVLIEAEGLLGVAALLGGAREKRRAVADVVVQLGDRRTGKPVPSLLEEDERPLAVVELLQGPAIS
jgi:hypothetical protein